MTAALNVTAEDLGSEGELSAAIIPFPEVAHVDAPDIQVSTAELAAAVPAERDHAWRDALTSHLPALKRYASKLSRNRHDRDDLVQECVARALSAGDAHPPHKGKVRSWLLTILHNNFVNDVRRGSTRRSLAEELGHSTPTCSQPLQIAGLQMGDLAEAVNRLPKFQRTILLMVCVEEMSYKEVAAALEIPIGTVMSTLARARQSLRQQDVR